MAEIYTEDLIQFLYNDTEESNDLSIAVATNSILRAEYESLKETLFQLDSMSLVPHSTSIDIIMEESKKYSAALAH